MGPKLLITPPRPVRGWTSVWPTWHAGLPAHGRQVALELANLSTERTMKLEWAFAGLPIWLISLDTCLVCATAPEPIFVGYSLHESAAGTTERPE